METTTKIMMTPKMKTDQKKDNPKNGENPKKEDDQKYGKEK